MDMEKIEKRLAVYWEIVSLIEQASVLYPGKDLRMVALDVYRGLSCRYWED